MSPYLNLPFSSFRHCSAASVGVAVGRAAKMTTLAGPRYRSRSNSGIKRPLAVFNDANIDTAANAEVVSSFLDRMAKLTLSILTITVSRLVFDWHSVQQRRGHDLISPLTVCATTFKVGKIARSLLTGNKSNFQTISQYKQPDR